MAVADHAGRFREEDIGFLQSLANVVAEGVARRRAAEEIAELSAARGRLVAQALDAEERARRSMSESLHDGALQDILAAGHDLWALGDEPGAEAARDMLRDVVAHLRSVMVALHPTVLAYGGLDAALRAVAAQQAVSGGFAVEVDVDSAAIGQRDELLLSVARELLTNAARHAEASHVRLTLERAQAASCSRWSTTAPASRWAASARRCRRATSASPSAPSGSPRSAAGWRSSRCPAAAPAPARSFPRPDGSRAPVAGNYQPIGGSGIGDSVPQ